MGVHLAARVKGVGETRRGRTTRGEPNLASERDGDGRERLVDESRDSSNGIVNIRGGYLTVTDREGSTADCRHSWRDKLARSRARVRLRLTLFHFQRV